MFLKKYFSILLLLLLFLGPGLFHAYGLTPSERTELIQIRELLIKSELKNTEARDKLRLSELELETQAEIILKLETTLAEHQQTLSNLEALHEKQLTELTAYYKNREIKTAVISGGVGLGAGAVIVLLLFLLF